LRGTNRLTGARNRRSLGVRQGILGTAVSGHLSPRFSVRLSFPVVQGRGSASAMTIQPTNLDELRKILADASARGEKVEAINVCALDRVVDHSPEDLTVTVEAGVALATLQAQLAQRGQWLRIDP